jgi:D-lactate dehydrogenase
MYPRRATKTNGQFHLATDFATISSYGFPPTTVTDLHVMITEKYAALLKDLSRIIPKERLLRDELSTLAYGTDASYFRLIPKIVVKVENEEEVITVLRCARQLGLPLTFRAAGTSLSGQAISDSILVVLGRSWTRHRIIDAGAKISLQPGIVGAHANAILAPLGRKIGPDPASINACMIGGIAANNASGMCCGTAQNSYRTLASMRTIFADGTPLDTGDQESKRRFAASRPDLVTGVASLARRVKENAPLADRISYKYRMKNTTGYSLNALVDFDDPIDIIQHLMIGSEGTLGFIAEITYNTVPELPHKASALILFPDIATACAAVPVLKVCRVDAVEIMDRASLRSVEEKAGMPSYLKTLGENVASLLVETRAESRQELEGNIADITAALSAIATVRPVEFTPVPAEFALLWSIRKGLFPSVGAMRETGTTVIIEDVAFPLPRLAEATLDLQNLFKKYEYREGIIFGHALEGNLHFVFNQDFNRPAEIERYRAFMDDVTSMVVRKYDGALKAEHGTGRNVAPFVELEWGTEAYGIMKEIKQLFDPEGLLNPGVILNPDPRAHISNLKPLPAAHPIVDKCIECGFCEVQCPSRNLTLTPRQRIVIYREMERLRTTRNDVRRLERLASKYEYQGEQTCATDGLCSLSCPVGIDTGRLIKDLRLRQHSPAAEVVASAIAHHMGLTTAILRSVLNLVHVVHRTLGTRFMQGSANLARTLSGERIPLWTPFMPKGASRLPAPSKAGDRGPTVVYFPTCINRTFGPAKGEEGEPSLSTLIVRLLEKAGYRVVYPAGHQNLCCGMAFASKGFKAAGDAKARELEAALVQASNNGEYPILTDMSPCLYRMKEMFTTDLKVMEPVKFVEEFLAGALDFSILQETVAIHTTCSSEKMGLAANLKRVAEMCAQKVVVPAGIGCCGWAGDRGFTHPELNSSALYGLRDGLPAECVSGYSTSRTCEIGLSLHSGIHYRSILYLVDRSTTRGKTRQSSGD